MTPVTPDNVEDLIVHIIAVLNESGIEPVKDLLDTLHPADIARLLESIPPEDRDQVWPLIDNVRRGETLIEVSDGVREGLMTGMDNHTLAAAIHNLDTDEIADLIPELPDEVYAEVIYIANREKREQLQEVLSYHEDTAGGLMDIDAVAIRPRITVAVTRRYLRMLGSLPEYTDKLFVVNRDNELIGTLTLARLLTAEDSQLIGEISNTDSRSFTADQTQREVARAFARYNLMSAPVVDEGKRLLGRITVDDVVDVIQDEADRMMMAPAGLDEEEDIFAPVIQTSRSRAVWLGINLITAFVAAVAIGRFQETISSLVALAVLMPVVASMGGNIGIQSLTVVIRGMGNGTITDKNAARVFFKELLVGSLNGLVWAVVVAIVTLLWFDNLALAIIISFAMVITMISSALFGAFLPVFLRRIGIDPALAGGVALTTVADVVGFVSFLGLAAVFLT
jgi:magnesium transporter